MKDRSPEEQAATRERQLANYHALSPEQKAARQAKQNEARRLRARGMSKPDSGIESDNAMHEVLKAAIMKEVPLSTHGRPRAAIALVGTTAAPVQLTEPVPAGPVALVSSMQSGVPDEVTAKLSPIDKALFTWFSARREDCIAFEDSRTKWSARKVVGDGTTHTGAAAFLWQLEDKYGHQEVVLYGALGYPAVCTLAFRALGSFGYRVLALEQWLATVRNASVGSLPPAESDEADGVYGLILDQLAQGKLLPEVAQFVGWNTFTVGKFVRDYGKKYPDARVDLSLAHDLGLQTVTMAIADAMDERLAANKLDALSVAVLQARLTNFRALAIRLSGSAYAAPAAQKTQVNIAPSNSGMRVDVRYHGGADDDIVDVLAHLPRLEP